VSSLDRDARVGTALSADWMRPVRVAHYTPAFWRCRFPPAIFDLSVMEHFDLIIVGAGPGGSNAAAVALRAGLTVVQIDGATFPRVKPCAGGLTAKAAAALQPEFGPLSALPFTAIEFNVWRGRGNRFGHREPVLHTVCRPDFDNELVRRNLAHPGFTFIDDCRARRVDFDGKFTVTTTKGALTGRQLIGADGAYSLVNRTFRVSAPRGFATALEINIPRPAGRSVVPCFDYGAVDRGYGWVFPKTDHLSVGLYTISPRTRRIRGQFLAYVRSKRLAVADDSLADLEAFRVPVGGFRLKVPACPVYVIGDAGGFADALTGEGIYAALESGRLAGETAVRVARGRETHRAYYRRLWRSVLCDTALTFFAAGHFYEDIDRGLRLLEQPFVWRTLIEGAARGATLSESALKSGSLMLRSVASGAVTSHFASA
jgi:geranylgeranyl reductase family protein